MDKLQWFKFSPTDWRMGKIQKLPEVTQLRFIQLMCLYWNKSCNLSIEDAEIDIDKEHLDLLVSKRVVKISGNNIMIEFLNEQFVHIGETKQDKSLNGKIGNLKRWNPELYEQYLNNNLSLEDALRIATQSHTDSTPIAPQSQNIADKKREDKSNNSNLTVDWDAFLIQFNDITGKKIRVLGEKEKRQIKARLKEGHTKDDIVTCIKNCFNDPYHKETGHKYLTPEFISRPDKFQKYLNINPSSIISASRQIGAL